MHADLQRVIQLQRLETFADAARRKIAEHPQRVQALDARLADATGGVASARQRLADNQTGRRDVEKDLAGFQARLAKYKDQLLELKTNREYQAMQHEIASAQGEVGRCEDRILELMLEADELGRAVKQTEAELAKAQAEVDGERAALGQERHRLEAELERTTDARTALAKEISRPVMAIFDTLVRGRKGIAVSEARQGLCTECHVRLRPQVFNEVLRNDAIIQCDSCQRILYVAADNKPRTETAASSPNAAGAS
jgi:uncharacterized protein